MGRRLSGLARRLRARALSYPGAYEDRPWGEPVFRVRGKIFLFLSEGSPLSLSVKLPKTSGMALVLPFVDPTGYGLGATGWVTATLAERDEWPEPFLFEWLDESYHAVAPKKRAPGRPAKAPRARRKR